MTYRADSVVFKNIKRTTPIVVETVTWTFDELQIRTLQLLECIQSIEVAVEIFGLDCTEAISADFDTYCKFVLHAVPPERQSELRERHSRLVTLIRESQKASPEQKREALFKALFYNYGLRDMQCRGLKFSSADSAIMVEVPPAAMDLNDDAQILSRIDELPRFAVLALSIRRNVRRRICRGI